MQQLIGSAEDRSKNYLYAFVLLAIVIFLFCLGLCYGLIDPVIQFVKNPEMDLRFPQNPRQ